MAAFRVITYGRIEVITEGRTNEGATPRFFVGETGVVVSEETFGSHLPSDLECRDLPQQLLAVRGLEVTAEDLGLPWPGPLYVALLPE